MRVKRWVGCVRFVGEGKRGEGKGGEGKGGEGGVRGCIESV